MRGLRLLIHCVGLLVVWAGQLQAALTIDIFEVDSNVTASFSGSINNEAIPFAATIVTMDGLDTGGTNFRGLFNTSGTYYAYGIKGLQPFSPLGTLNRSFDSRSPGSLLGFAFLSTSKTPAVVVPSPTPGTFSTNATGTWNNTTIDALGLTKGTSTWHWGTGSQQSSVTIQIGSLGAAVPEPNLMAFVVIGAISTAGIRRRKRAGKPTR